MVSLISHNLKATNIYILFLIEIKI